MIKTYETFLNEADNKPILQKMVTPDGKSVLVELTDAQYLERRKKQYRVNVVKGEDIVDNIEGIDITVSHNGGSNYNVWHFTYDEILILQDKLNKFLDKYND